MVDCDIDGGCDVIDAEILEQEKAEKKDNSECFVLLFAAVMLISLVAWSFSHYLIQIILTLPRHTLYIIIES